MRVVLCFVAVGLSTACGASDSDRQGMAPQISSLSYDPLVAHVDEPATIFGSIDFEDADGDVAELALSLSAPDGRVLRTGSVRLARDPRFPQRRGTVSFEATFTPVVAGPHGLDVSVLDSRDNESNHLMGDIDAREPGGGPEPPPDGGATGSCQNGDSVPVLGFDVVDAEYDTPLDRIVIVSEGPNVLHVLDPATGTDATVSLPTVPTSVSVGPDGTHAAVGHNGYVSYVDLEGLSVIDTWPVTTDAIDVVLANNGYVYVFPRTDQWEEIRSIQLSDGAETTSGPSSIYAGTVAKLAPGKLAMYGANRGLSPSDIARYDIGEGTAKVLYDSPYHGDHEMCGDLWLNQDASRIFTRCGNVFRGSDLQQNDMTYAGSLADLQWIVHLTHSAAANAVVAIGGKREFAGTGGETVTGDSVVRVYTGDFYDPAPSLPLPCVGAAGQARIGHGRYVFVRSDGSDVYAIVGADNSGAPPLRFGLATLQR